jgi:hypothetical protein
MTGFHFSVETEFYLQHVDIGIVPQPLFHPDSAGSLPTGIKR